MKRFQFSLHAVRDLREAEEESAQKNYAAAVRACEEAAVRLTVLDLDLRNVWQGIRNHVRQGMSAEQMRHAHAWCLVLEAKQKELVKELAVCQRRVDAAHERLQLAMRRREGLDRLHRKQRREHERTARAEEQKFLDEIATRSAWHGAAQLEVA